MSTTPSQLSPKTKVESIYREVVLPNVSDLFKNYEFGINHVLEIQVNDLKRIQSPDELTCCFHYGVVVCGAAEECNGNSCPELPFEQKQQICEEILSILRSVFIPLKEALEKAAEEDSSVFRITFFIAQDQDINTQSNDDFKPCCFIASVGFCCAPNRSLLCQRCNCFC